MYVTHGKDLRKVFIISILAVIGIALVVFYFGKTEEPSAQKGVEQAAKRIAKDQSQSRGARVQAMAQGQDAVAAKGQDRRLFLESLEKGYVPTQETGEMGSAHGVLTPDSGMLYAPTKYERLADSPLLRFTDEMIWREGDDYVVKRDAVRDQGLHLQEASIALSVSARIEWGQLTGYRLVEVPEGTLFSKLGIVSGDVVLSINGGKPDMEVMALMFVNMVAKHGKSVLELEHQGQVRKIVIRAAE